MKHTHITMPEEGSKRAKMLQATCCVPILKLVLTAVLEIVTVKHRTSAKSSPVVTNIVVKQALVGKIDCD